MNNKEFISRLREKGVSIYVRTLQRAYFRMLGHQIDQRFAIIGHARTGSNYLLNGLKSSASIRMYHEIFADHNRQMGKDFDKIFYNHLTEEEWKKLMACKDLKVIHLIRRNRLRTIISLEIAFKTGQWMKSKNSGQLTEKRITLDPSKLIERLEQIENEEAAARARFRDRQMLEIVYEELVQAPHEVFASVGKYLGVDGIDPGRIRLKRQNPETLQQLIVNYDEVKAKLKNTRFVEYING